jgi:MFS family permease
MFAAGFALWGTAEALSSGTEEGLIYDNLKSENRESEFTAIYGRGRFYASLGAMAAIISSGILANFISINAISVLSALICAASLIFIYPVKEKNYYSERLEKEDIGFLQTFSEAARLCVKNSKILIGMVFLVFIVSVVTGYLDEYDALIIDDFKMGYIWVSVILAVRFIFIALGNHIAAKVEEKLQSKNAAFILAIGASLFLFAFAALWNHYAIPLMGIACLIMTIAEVIQIDTIQREINEEGRSTVMSFYSIGVNTVMILFSLIYALLAGIYSLQMVYVFISIYCVLGAVLMFFVNLAAKKNIEGS